ncbi:hypothetical protein A2Z33_04525 [Candidatus Gottesmanbacteria bacterium RBG_16_52_11]|uniref:Helix-turn-helix domain-containing protein n=1 Tax=Candidatus Gottesmanbacteria bacterium RBG_16_52_11 TaxID=1798374 RepID=A0A1F5YN16_9BACT|nr:MAG: hypothetical protein A2Z33_04525 [Candidatus Gottesmanbacteria bacterium RBG_16_52_11]
MSQQTYTVKQVADILGYSTNSIYSFLKARRIKGVRVGKGRFRIPQAEIDRLLDRKSPASKQLASVAGEIKPAVAVEASELKRMPLRLPHVNVPDIFDWFTGISAVAVGLALFLVSGIFEGLVVFDAAWLPVLGTLLVAAGTAILYSDISGSGRSVWYGAGVAGIVLANTFISYIFWIKADSASMVLFGLIAGSLAAKQMLRISPRQAFLYTAMGIGSIVPFLLLSREPSQLSNFSLHFGGVSARYTWIIVAAILALSYRYFTGKIGGICSTCLWLGAALLFYVSLEYSYNAAWPQAMLVLVLAAMLLLSSIWQTLAFFRRTDRKYVFTTLGFVLIALSACIGVIRLLQDAVLRYASVRLEGTVLYARELVESSVDRLSLNVETAASNPLVAELLASGSSAGAQDLVRSFYASRSNIRRIMLAKTDGTAAAVYPIEATVSGAVSEDLLIRTLASRRAVLSENAALPGSAGSPTVVISVPVLNAEKEVVGIVASEMDFEQLAYRLSLLAVPGSGEYVEVTSRSGRKFIGHEPEVQVPGPVVDVPSGKQSVVLRQTDAAGSGILVAYSESAKYHWTVTDTLPVTRAVQASQAASIPLMVAMACTVMLVLVVSVLNRSYRLPREDTS